MKDSILFESTTLGPYSLKNRIVLPPLTRSLRVARSQATFPMT